jgi:hypothetical protein
MEFAVDDSLNSCSRVERIKLFARKNHSCFRIHTFGPIEYQ